MSACVGLHILAVKQLRRDWLGSESHFRAASSGSRSTPGCERRGRRNFDNENLCCVIRNYSAVVANGDCGCHRCQADLNADALVGAV